MATLVIQSVFPRAILLILDESGKLLTEKSWQSDKDEVEKLPPAIETVLSECGFVWADINRVVIVVGTGNFSSTRISVTIANVLSMLTDARLYELVLGQEFESKDLHKLVADKFEAGWKPVKIAKPVYKTKPLITPSKKQRFN